jgi:uncharacterized protein (DUF983 family)
LRQRVARRQAVFNSLSVIDMLPAMTLSIEHGDHQLSQTRSWKLAIWRGLRCSCPACGKGHMFRKFLKVADTCDHCGEELHHQRADDAPPYFTMFIVGHIVIPLVLVVEKLWAPPLEVHFVLWTTVTLGLTFALMPAVKGAIVGLQWALKMHGFDYAARIEGE